MWLTYLDKGAMMKIVLVEEVHNLGVPGDVVTVKDGYARNFLIPAGFALKADPKKMKMLTMLRRTAEQKALREVKTHQSLADRLKQLEVVAKVQVGEEDRMFGAVTSVDIAALIAEKDVEIDRRIIQLPEPLKALGSYTVPIKLHAEVEAFIRVKVVKED
jgi:large subunit ribosomal protein L9